VLLYVGWPVNLQVGRQKEMVTSRLEPQVSSACRAVPSAEKL
jgi:hypothetical protein